MKHPISLYDCTCKLDAYFLKNIIQRITCISVEILRNHGELTLIVDDCNYHKAKSILDSQLHLLPSLVAKKVTEEVEEEVITIPFQSHSISENLLDSLVGFSFLRYI